MARNRESADAYTSAVASMIAGLPTLIDPGVPLGELGAVGTRMHRLGTLVGEIHEQERKDYRRLLELSERPVLRREERHEAEACMRRLLDGERARDLAREWWNVNRQSLRTLATRMGEDGRALASLLTDVAELLPAENYELRAWLRRAKRRVHGTWRQRLLWYVGGCVAAVLRRGGAALHRWAGANAPDRGRDEPS